MGVAENQAAKVTAFVESQLEAGERVEAVLGQAMKGPSSWTVALVSPLLTFLQKPFAVAVTDRRVLLVQLKMSMTSYSPKALDTAWPRAGVTASFQHGPLTGTLVLQAPGVEPMKLSVQMVFLKSAEAIATSLGGNPVAAGA